MQELATLKQKQHVNGVPQVDSNVMASYNGKVASLEVKVARLEHKCLELAAEKQMELDAATIPRYCMSFYKTLNKFYQGWVPNRPLNLGNTISLYTHAHPYKP